MTDLDLQQEIERSFGDGPSHRPLEQRIGAGRRTVQRRRLGAAAAVVAVVAVVGTAYSAAGPVVVADLDRQVAVDPPSVDPPSADPSEDGRWRDALRLAEDGSVVASPGTTVLQRTDDPRLGDAFAPPGTPTGAAVLQPARSREVSSVVWRVVDGELEVFRVPSGDVVGATFEELLSYVRGQFAAGEEL